MRSIVGNAPALTTALSPAESQPRFGDHDNMTKQSDISRNHIRESCHRALCRCQAQAEAAVQRRYKRQRGLLAITTLSNNVEGPTQKGCRRYGHDQQSAYCQMDDLVPSSARKRDRQGRSCSPVPVELQNSWRNVLALTQRLLMAKGKNMTEVQQFSQTVLRRLSGRRNKFTKISRMSSLSAIAVSTELPW